MIDLTHQGPFCTVKPIVLASASPRRQQLLTSLGIHFAVHPSRVTEGPPVPGETPHDYAVRMARDKAADVALQRPDAVVLGYDTIVVTRDAVLGKPTDRLHALDMLRCLNGDTHRVVSGWSMFWRGTAVRESAVATEVTFGSFPLAVLEAYSLTGEAMDKAGAYAIQGAGAFLVKTVSGSVSNVIGLPLRETVAALLELEAIGVDAAAENTEGSER
ncbi:MAG: Maf family protein [Desulfohalobiaceae bacterium]